MAPIPLRTSRDCESPRDPLSVLIFCLSDNDASLVEDGQSSAPASQNTTGLATRHRLFRRDDRNDGVIIGIVFGIVFFIAFFCVAIYFHSHTKHSAKKKKMNKKTRRNKDKDKDKDKDEEDDEADSSDRKNKDKGTKTRRRSSSTAAATRWPSTAAMRASWLMDGRPFGHARDPAVELADMPAFPAAAYPPNEMDAPQIIYPHERAAGLRFYNARV